MRTRKLQDRPGLTCIKAGGMNHNLNYQAQPKTHFQRETESVNTKLVLAERRETCGPSFWPGGFVSQILLGVS